MKSTIALVLGLAWLNLGPAPQEDQGQGAQRYDYESETAQAFGLTPGGDYVALSIVKSTLTGEPRLHIDFSTYAPPDRSSMGSCDLPADAFSIRNGRAALTVELPGPGATCSSLYPASTRIDVRLVAIPGESEDAHTTGETTWGGVRYQSQQRYARWSAEMAGSVSGIDFRQHRAELETRRTVEIRKD